MDFINDDLEGKIQILGDKIEHTIKSCALDVIITSMSLFATALSLDAINYLYDDEDEKRMFLIMIPYSIFTISYVYIFIKYNKFLFPYLSNRKNKLY